MKLISKAQTARLTTAFILALAYGCSTSNSVQQTSSDTGSTVEPMNVTLTLKRGTSNGTPTLVATRVITTQLRIDGIDYDTRGIVLTGPEGHQEIFTVGPEVVNFDQLHKGDLVTAKFTEKLGVSVREADEPAEEVEIGQIDLPPIGDKPGIVASRSGQFTAVVSAIDLSTRIVTLTGPTGNVAPFKVAPQAKGLEKVQVGDHVIIDYSEAVEIFVTSGS